jgi:two-component system, NarL family, response regulator DevR
MIQILLVDDHVAVREGLAAVLNGDPDLRVVAQAEGPEELVRRLHVTSPDVVMIDLHLQGGSGLDLCRRIWGTAGGLRIIGLADGRDVGVVAEAFEAGAHGVLLKGASPCMIREACRTVARGDVFVDPAVAARLLRLEARKLDEDPEESLKAIVSEE